MHLTKELCSLLWIATLMYSVTSLPNPDETSSELQAQQLGERTGRLADPHYNSRYYNRPSYYNSRRRYSRPKIETHYYAPFFSHYQSPLTGYLWGSSSNRRRGSTASRRRRLSSPSRGIRGKSAAYKRRRRNRG